MRKWRVSVFIEGENVLNIEDESLSGLPNVSDFREEILCAADNLIAFISREERAFEIPEIVGTNPQSSIEEKEAGW